MIGCEAHREARVDHNPEGPLRRRCALAHPVLEARAAAHEAREGEEVMKRMVPDVSARLEGNTQRRTPRGAASGRRRTAAARRSFDDDGYRRLHLGAMRSSRVVDAVASQVSQALRPFDRYLQTMVRATRERQARLGLPWRLAERPREIGLEPLDTAVWVPRRTRPMWRVRGWGEAAVPQRPIFLIDLDRVVDVQVAGRTGADVLVELVEGGEPGGDSLKALWGGRPVTLVREAEARPHCVRDAQGREFEVRNVREVDEGFLLVVEGRIERLAGEGRILGRFEGLDALYDARGAVFRAQPSQIVARPPSGKTLAGRDGRRFRWFFRDGGKNKGQGVWVQLELPEGLGDEGVDPRALFCSALEDVVWTAPRRRAEDVIRVLRVDVDAYQLLLERRPPEPDGQTRLYLPLDVRALELQRRAIYQLRTGPLLDHAPLVRLCADPANVRWPQPAPVRVDRWYVLRDATRSGTDEQQRFVECALATPDFAVLEGPPGSGKTTVIVELILQLVARGQRVLMVSNTNVAVDNVVERLVGHAEAPSVTRIGRRERVDESLARYTLDAQVEALCQSWAERGQVLGEGGADEARAAAQRLVVAASDVVCSTMGSLKNLPLDTAPDELDWRQTPWARPLVRQVPFDVLILDEASKTLLPEFLHAALLARRHVIVGDIAQLPPFADRDALEANIESLAEAAADGSAAGEEAPRVSPAAQRAAHVRFVLQQDQWWRDEAVRIALVAPAGELEALEREFSACRGDVDGFVVRIDRNRPPAPRRGAFVVTEAALREGRRSALALWGAKVVLVDADRFPRVSPYLPPDFLVVRLGNRRPECASAFDFRQARHWARCGNEAGRWRARGRPLGLRELQEHLQETLTRRTWASEVAWRLARRHELRRAKDRGQRERLGRDVQALIPAGAGAREAVARALDDIARIGLPSVIEVLQEGVELSGNRRHHSGLVDGLRQSASSAFAQRFVRLSYQHRMHPTIAAYARLHFYAGKALQGANTIASRDEALGWTWRPLGQRADSRLLWLDVRGAEHGGVNEQEVEAVLAVLEDFARWAWGRGALERPGAEGRWTVACLSFYVRQERALADAIGRRCEQAHRKTRFEWPDAPVSIVAGTVDRFQGREADVVLLSLRNTRRIGFLDSPNRLNVALTRARQHLIVVGRRGYFAHCRLPELEALAREAWPLRYPARSPRRS